MEKFNPRKYWRGRSKIETFKISAPACDYGRFWHGVEPKPDLVIVFHYENLPKRVNRTRRHDRLGKLVDMVLRNDFFTLNTFGNDQEALENKGAVVGQIFREWLGLHARKEFGNLRRHLVAITVVS